MDIRDVAGFDVFDGDCPLTLCSACAQACLAAQVGVPDRSHWCEVCQVDFAELNFNENNNLWFDEVQIA